MRATALLTNSSFVHAAFCICELFYMWSWYQSCVFMCLKVLLFMSYCIVLSLLQHLTPWFVTLHSLPVQLERSFGASRSWLVTLETQWISAPLISARVKCSWVNSTRTDRDFAMTTTLKQRCVYRFRLKIYQDWTSQGFFFLSAILRQNCDALYR